MKEKANLLLESLEDTLDSFYKRISFNENNSGTPISARSAIPSRDRARLEQAYETIKNVLYEPNFDIEFQQDRILVTLKDKAKISFDYTPYMGSLVEYMLDRNLPIKPLPEIKVRYDEVEGADFFGKTAYYDPNSQEITLFAKNRHPKDVMRSFAHEMIHHMQNVEGRLGEITTQNTNEDGSLNEIEEEAYLLGNILFRNWEDGIKETFYNN